MKIGVEVNYYTILESAKRKGEIAIGYKIAALSSDSSHAYGVCVNPDKSKMIAYTADDKIIVLAEDL